MWVEKNDINVCIKGEIYKSKKETYEKLRCRRT